MGSRANRVIYVGNLPGGVKDNEIDNLFYKYGRIMDIDLKIPYRPPAYCFIEFEDARDAEDAIRGRNENMFDGNRLRVEIARFGRGPRPILDRRSVNRVNPINLRRSQYKVTVSGLPSSTSWQDLKDHMRQAGDVDFVQIFSSGSSGTMGVVDFTNYDDMKYAIRYLDNSEFRNPFSNSFIRVKKHEGSRSRKSMSRSWNQSRSCSSFEQYSPSRTRSRSQRHSWYKARPWYGSVSRSMSLNEIRTPSKTRSTSKTRSPSKSGPQNQIPCNERNSY